MKTVIYNIGTLAGILPEGTLKLEGAQMNHVECIENAYLVIEDGIISEFGANTGSNISLKNNPSHDIVAGPSPCGQGGSTVFQPLAASGNIQEVPVCGNHGDYRCTVVIASKPLNHPLGTILRTVWVEAVFRTRTDSIHMCAKHQSRSCRIDDVFGNDVVACASVSDAVRCEPSADMTAHRVLLE